MGGAHSKLTRLACFIEEGGLARCASFRPAPRLPLMQVPWHQLLTSQLDDVTKLVGATISCSGVKLNISHPTYFQPHVQVWGATVLGWLAQLQLKSRGAMCRCRAGVAAPARLPRACLPPAGRRGT